MVKKQTVDGRVAEQKNYQEERIARLIRLAARSFNRSLQLRLATQGVTFGQWIFLRILWKHDGLSQLTEPTAHTALMRMEELGLIERRKVGTNKRRQHAFLTQKGRDLRDRLEPLAIETNELAVAGLSDDEVQNLRHALAVVIRNLEQDEVDSAARGVRMPSTRSLQQP